MKSIGNTLAMRDDISIISNDGGVPQQSLQALRAACRMDGVYTLFYYDDISEAARWYESVIGFEKYLDYGWLAIFRLREGVYLGLVTASCGSQRPVDGDNKGVLLTISMTDLEAWHRHLLENGVPGVGHGLAIGHGGLTMEFKLKDPGGYTIEFFEWLAA